MSRIAIKSRTDSRNRAATKSRAKLLQPSLLVSLVILTLLSAGMLGCHRSYYRRQADADAERLISEKSNNDHWDVGPFSIETDPRSRMTDPFSVDHPPLPPDDPASHCYMQEVDGKPGYQHWHANGDARIIENPEWQSFLPINSDGVVVLDMDSAFRLALLHSREYQQQKEELFLSALSVSLERFSFETQFFSPLNGSFDVTGGERDGGARTNGLFGSTGQGKRLEKAGIAGSQLVINLANSLVWQLSGPDTNAINTTLGFELVQPLLRGAGRDRILASLTESERDLLANVRQMERFRRGFYLQISVGSNAGSGVSRGGGFLGAAQGGSTGGASGVLGLLQTQQNIRIQEANVASQIRILALLEEFAAANRISLLQLQQFRTNLYNSQANLLQNKADYQTALDRFKITLGLPPGTDIEIEDASLDKFILIDDSVLQRQNELYKLQENSGNIIVPIIKNPGYETADIDEDSTFAWSDDIGQRINQLKDMLKQIDDVRKSLIEQDIPQAEKDIELFESSSKTRKESLVRLQQQVEKLYDNDDNDIPPVDPRTLDENRLDDTSAELSNSFEKLKERSNELEKNLETQAEMLDKLLKEGPDKTGKKLKESLKENALDSMPKLLTDMSGIVGEISLLQARARNDRLLLKEIDISAEQALEIARVFRRDWMNARAELVDVWRNIEFVADNLESQLDLTFAGDVQNVGDNPLALRTSAGRLAVGFRFDAPITRQVERNQYRNALIEFQRARRNYMQFKDQISQTLRLIVRNIEISKLNFEIRRENTKVAAQALELAQFRLEEPPRPGQGSSQLSDSTARNLVEAYNGLQGAQRAQIDVYVTYEVLRRNLDFQMGTMELDAEGFWLDPGPITKERGMAIAPPYQQLPLIVDDDAIPDALENTLDGSSETEDLPELDDDRGSRRDRGEDDANKPEDGLRDDNSRDDLPGENLPGENLPGEGIDKRVPNEIAPPRRLELDQAGRGRSNWLRAQQEMLTPIRNPTKLR